MNYDDWKADVPDPGASGHGKSPVALFRRNYPFFARQNRAADYLDLHRTDPQFAEAIAAIESDGDWFCQYHGQPLVYDGYWRSMTGGCVNCEGKEPDGEAFRGGEAAAYEAEQMAVAQRLKR